MLLYHNLTIYSQQTQQIMLDAIRIHAYSNTHGRKHNEREESIMSKQIVCVSVRMSPGAKGSLHEEAWQRRMSLSALVRQLIEVGWAQLGANGGGERCLFEKP